MQFELVTIKCLTDNYAFLLRDSNSGQVALIDAPEAGPIEQALTERGWTLDEIWITHHHDDHIAGVDMLRSKYGAIVLGNSADSARLPRLDRAVAAGSEFEFGGATIYVLDVPGHTIGHIAFYLADQPMAFTGDSLMALGCGRLFEGSAEQMWPSLSQFLTLPQDTLICSGHEYTATNARFALTVDPDNAALAERAKQIFAATEAGEPTVPSKLRDEMATNPFLRPGDPSIRSGLGLENATDTEVFAEIRKRKDNF